MMKRTEKIMNDFEATLIPCSFIGSTDHGDIIELQNNSYAQGGVLSGILEDNGLDGGLGDYITDWKVDEHNCPVLDECECEPSSYYMEIPKE